ncbi:MAG: adenylate/guanylate cyclase domain-containing protein [Hyphomicrobiales bacterium]|nr:adenylate/guanylate cyclase domain-containing protein [Hyphomicrobiales bacterium]
MPSLRQIRLTTGLVLYVYVTLHFANHALGNISVGEMESGLVLHRLIWHSLPGAAVLYLSLLTHMSLGFWALYQRRRFRWTRLEATQLVFGLSIPFLLADHLVGTRIASIQFGLHTGYQQELLVLWVLAPVFGVLQAILLLIVWIHGCLGVHFWLKLKPFYRRVKEPLFAAAVLLPTLALLGYYQGGERTLVSAEDPAWLARAMAPERMGTEAQNAVLVEDRTHLLIALAVALTTTLLARGFRQWRENHVGSIRLTYPDRSIRVARGFSVLEASLINGIPHAHVCGGRGRCSTCRIRILGEPDDLPEPSIAERAVLERVHAGPGVRLACQLRPIHDIAFVPMLSPYATMLDVYRFGAPNSGVERYLVIMFVDMRGSSRLAETRLPFDTVFIINQFLNAVSHAVLNAGGEPNQVLGDGLLALFGMSDTPDVACRQAIAASAAIADRVESLNAALAHSLVEPIRFGIGIHAGLIVAGAIGYERHAQFTVIGDPVNVAARLQDLTKVFECEVLMSEEVYKRVGFAPDVFSAHEVEARGREGTVEARSVKRAADLAAPIAARAPAAS